MLSRIQVGHLSQAIEHLSQAIEYEALHNVCFSCGIVGHRMDKCPSQPSVPSQPANDAGGGEANKGETEVVQPTMATKTANENYGPWMLVNRKLRKGSGSKGKQQPTTVNSDS